MSHLNLVREGVCVSYFNLGGNVPTCDYVGEEGMPLFLEELVLHLHTTDLYVCHVSPASVCPWCLLCCLSEPLPGWLWQGHHQRELLPPTSPQQNHQSSPQSRSMNQWPSHSTHLHTKKQHMIRSIIFGSSVEWKHIVAKCYIFYDRGEISIILTAICTWLSYFLWVIEHLASSNLIKSCNIWLNISDLNWVCVMYD